MTGMHMFNTPLLCPTFQSQEAIMAKITKNGLHFRNLVRGVLVEEDISQIEKALLSVAGV